MNAAYTKKMPWHDLIANVVVDLKNGIPASEISRKCVDIEFTGMGLVQKLVLFQDVLSIRMRMPRIDFNLADGRSCYVELLILKVDDQQKSLWARIEQGSHVCFSAQVDVSASDNNPFETAYGIGLSDVDEAHCYVTIDTKSAKPIIENG